MQDKVEAWDKSEVSWVTSFDSSNGIVYGSLEKDGSSLHLRDKEVRSFKGKVVDERESTLDNLLDRHDSRPNNLEGKEYSSKVVSSFFETEEILLWVGVEWNDELVLWSLEWDSFEFQ